LYKIGQKGNEIFFYVSIVVDVNATESHTQRNTTFD